jgi:hypothetical protein
LIESEASDQTDEENMNEENDEPVSEVHLIDMKFEVI